MAKKSRFRTLNAMPESVQRASSLARETADILDQIKATRGRVLEYSASTPKAAKSRAESLRRARKRGRTRLKRVSQLGNKLYIEIR